MAQTLTDFHLTTPSLENYWRAIILFGRNVASYKFALAKALLKSAQASGDLIRLEDLAEPFAQEITQHLRLADKQATSASSRFLDTCRGFNSGEVSIDQMHEITVRLGFNNVIDAFHVVNQGKLPVRFFEDERGSHKAIRLTEHFHKLKECCASGDLVAETEARWRLVETAWELDISSNLITVRHDPRSHELFAPTRTGRVDITSCRDSLNGYQKGWCFYCFDRISVIPGDACLGDVDHFFPHVLKGLGFRDLIDGVWNLVLACRSCNRGKEGKSARVPSTDLLARLHRRNEYLIESHHPLRETLMQQTGRTKLDRRDFLQMCHTEATDSLIHHWQPKPRRSPAF